MEPENLHLKISGPLLGKILHERHRIGSNCGGLLYGEIIPHTRTEITDSQHTTKTEAFVCIQDYIPRSSSDILKNKTENEAWTDNYSPVSKCVGIFKLRKSLLQMTVLEKSMHRQLTRKLKANMRSKDIDFIVTLVITDKTDQMRTSLSWRVAAYVYHAGSFSPIKIEISNLQGSVSGLYVTNPSPLQAVESASANAALNSFESSLTSEAGEINVVNSTRRTTDNLARELGEAFSKLQHQEELLETALEEKVSLLQELSQLREKKRKPQHPPQNYADIVKTGAVFSGVTPKHDVLATASNPTAANPELSYHTNDEDIRMLSPVVMLDKSGVDRRYLRSRDIETQRSIESSSARVKNETFDDPFANLVLSAKEKLEATNSPAQQDRVNRSDETNWDMAPVDENPRSTAKPSDL